MSRPKLEADELRKRLHVKAVQLGRAITQRDLALNYAEQAIKAAEGGNVKEARRVVAEGKKAVEAAGAGSAGAVEGAQAAGDAGGKA